MDSPGRQLVDAIARRDRSGLRTALADDVDFKGLTPRRLWEATSAADVDEIVFGSWFEEQDRVDSLALVEEDAVADIQRVGYRLELTTPDGPHVVEQQAYYRATDDGRIGYLRVVCSGFRPR